MDGWIVGWMDGFYNCIDVHVLDVITVLHTDECFIPMDVITVLHTNGSFRHSTIYPSSSLYIHR